MLGNHTEADMHNSAPDWSTSCATAFLQSIQGQSSKLCQVND